MFCSIRMFRSKQVKQCRAECTAMLFGRGANIMGPDVS